MQPKKNSVTATLTDVKNKTGDVFSLADKHGSVVITSYNKPKYIISKYQAPALEEEKVTEKEPQKPARKEGPVAVPAAAPKDQMAKETPVTPLEAKQTPQLPEMPAKEEDTQAAADLKPKAEKEEAKERPAENVESPTSGSAVFTISAKDKESTASAPKETEPAKIEKPEQARPSPFGGLLGIFSHQDGWNRSSNRELNWTKKAQDLLN